MTKNTLTKKSKKRTMKKKATGSEVEGEKKHANTKKGCLGKTEKKDT